MPDFSRRSIILGTAGVAAAGAGVTAAASGLSGSVEGQADVEAEQALTIENVNIAGDDDADFTRVSDDNTSFQAAVELNNGDSVQFSAKLRNNANDRLSVQVAVDAPDIIDIDVSNSSGDNGASDPEDVDDNTDDDNADDSAVQTGEGTFVAKVKGTGDIDINAELDDTADPGSYDIGVAINPLSTDNN